MPRMRIAVLIAGMLTSPASAGQSIEAIGAETCGAASPNFTVEFLAPDDAQVEARAHVLVGGSEENREVTTLSLDGELCDESCSFAAQKGQTYVLVVEPTGAADDRLCISVVRP